MKLNDLVTLERGHLSWFQYPTHNIGTYLGRGVLGLTSQSVSHPISTHRLWKWKCQQYGYYALNIILLKIFHQRVYCSLMRCHAWNAILWGGCCGRLKGKKLPKKVSTKTPKKLSRWVALNYALWFQHRSDRTDVSDDEDWKLGYLTFSRSIVKEIWFCLLFILRQRKKLLIRIRQHLD